MFSLDFDFFPVRFREDRSKKMKRREEKKRKIKRRSSEKRRVEKKFKG